MENINLSSHLKLKFIKWLVVALVTYSSIGVSVSNAAYDDIFLFRDKNEELGGKRFYHLEIYVVTELEAVVHSKTSSGCKGKDTVIDVHTIKIDRGRVVKKAGKLPFDDKPLDNLPIKINSKIHEFFLNETLCPYDAYMKHSFKPGRYLLEVRPYIAWDALGKYKLGLEGDHKFELIEQRELDALELSLESISNTNTSVLNNSVIKIQPHRSVEVPYSRHRYSIKYKGIIDDKFKQSLKRENYPFIGEVPISDKIITMDMDREGNFFTKRTGKTEIIYTRLDGVEQSFYLEVVKANQTGFSLENKKYGTKHLGSTPYSKDKKYQLKHAGGESKGNVTYRVKTGNDVGEVNNDGEITIKKAGVITVTATKAGDENYNSTSASFTLTVNRADQSGFSLFNGNPYEDDSANNYEFVGINVAVVTTTYSKDKKYQLKPHGGATKGNVTYSVTKDSEKYGSVDKTGLITIKKAGEITVTATNDGGYNYNSTSALFKLTVNKANQPDFSLEGESGTKQTPFSEGGTYQLSTIGGTIGGNVTYQVKIGGENGTISSTGLISIKKVGEITVKATNDAGDNYNSVSASFTLEVTKGHQSKFSLKNEEGTSTSFEDAGLVVHTDTTTYSEGKTYQLKAFDEKTKDMVKYKVAWGVERVGDVDNTGLIAIEKAGEIYVIATIAGNSNYEEAVAWYKLEVMKGIQSGFYLKNEDGISNLANTTYSEGKKYQLSHAGGESGGDVAYSVTKESEKYASVDKTGLITIRKAGVITVKATIAGNSNYEKAEATFKLTVNRADQSGFSLEGEGDTENSGSTTYSDGGKYQLKPHGGATKGNVTYEVTGGTDVGDVDSNTGVITINKVGEITVTATKAGDENYNSTSASFTLTVNRADQSGFSLEGEGDTENSGSTTYSDGGKYQLKPHGGATKGNVTYSVTKDSEKYGSVDKTGLITINKVGEITVTATNNGGDNYNSTSASFTLTVNKANQTDFSLKNESGTEQDRDSIAYSTDKKYQLSHVGGESEGDVAYSVTEDSKEYGDVDSTGLITIKKAGEITVTATNDGGENYEKAEAKFTLTVEKGVQDNFKIIDVADRIKYPESGTYQLKTNGGSGDGAFNFVIKVGDDIASVDDKGLITFKGVLGTVTITATQSEGTNYTESNPANYTFRLEQGEKAIDTIDLPLKSYVDLVNINKLIKNYAADDKYYFLAANLDIKSNSILALSSIFDNASVNIFRSENTKYTEAKGKINFSVDYDVEKNPKLTTKNTKSKSVDIDLSTPAIDYFRNDLFALFKSVSGPVNCKIYYSESSFSGLTVDELNNKIKQSKSKGCGALPLPQIQQSLSDLEPDTTYYVILVLEGNNSSETFAAKSIEFEFKTEQLPHVILTPGAVDELSDSFGFPVDFDLSDPTDENYRSLTVYMHYDSSKLTFDGLVKDKTFGTDYILDSLIKIGFDYDPRIDYSEYREFATPENSLQYIEEYYAYSLLEGDIKKGDDDDSNTDKIVFISWGVPNSGIISDSNDFPVEPMFYPSFTRKDNFSDTTINFTYLLPEGYRQNLTSIDIAKPAPASEPEPYVILKPGAVDELSDTFEFPVEFDLSDRTDEDLKDLGVYMHYDSNKLTFNGLVKDKTFGTDIPSYTERLISELSRPSTSSKDSLEIAADYLATDMFNPEGGLHFDNDSDSDTDRVVYIHWSVLGSGIISDSNDFAVERMFYPSFARKDHFSDTKINFTYRSPYGYRQNLTSIDIAQREPEPKVSSISLIDGNVQLDAEDLKDYLVQSLAEDKRDASCEIYYSVEDFSILSEEVLKERFKKDLNKSCDDDQDLTQLELNGIDANKKYYAMLVLWDGENGEVAAHSKQFEFIKTPENSNFEVTIGALKEDLNNDMVTFPVSYKTKEDSDVARSLNLSMRYDSSKLSWKGINSNVFGVPVNNLWPDSELITTWSRIGSSEVFLWSVSDKSEDESLTDGNDLTDRIVHFHWYDMTASGNGLMGGKKFPVHLFETSFVRMPGFTSGSTRVSFTTYMAGEKIKVVGNATIDSGGLIVKPTDPEDSKSEPEQPAKPLNLDVNLVSEKVYDFYSVGENEYQLADTKPGETAENINKGYVEITPKDLAYNKETNKINFTVDYGVSDDRSNIPLLTMAMFYDSSQLTFNGLDGGSILGIHNDDPNKPSLDPIKRWRSADGYGEFNLVGDHKETIKMSDDDDLTDRLIYLQWSYNTQPHGRTFDDLLELKGFIGDKPMPAKLFDALFTPTEDFTGSTQINFKVYPIPEGNAGWKYGYKVSPIVITNSEPEPEPKLPQIILTPGAVKELPLPDSFGFPVDFDLSDPTDEDLRYLSVRIHYDSSKLTFKGLVKNKTFGTDNLNPTEGLISKLNRKRLLGTPSKDSLETVDDFLAADYFAPEDGPHFDNDSDPDTDRVVYIVWSVMESGIISDSNDFPVKPMFYPTFTREDNFSDTTINFTYLLTEGDGYRQNLTSIDIAQPEPKVSSISHPGGNVDVTLDVQALKTHLVRSLAEDKNHTSCEIYYSVEDYSILSEEVLKERFKKDHNKSCDDDQDLKKLELKDIDANKKYYAMLVLWDGENGEVAAQSKQFEFINEKYIEIEGSQKDKEGNSVEVGLTYDTTDGTTGIKNLCLYMFYDSSKLEFMGVDRDGVLGLVDDPSSVSPALGLIKKWTSKHGEFSFLDSWVYNYDEFTELYGEDFAKSYGHTDKLVYLCWSYNPNPEWRSFSDQARQKGFIGDDRLPVKLLERVSFVRKPNFDSGTTTIRFKADKIDVGDVGDNHDISRVDKHTLIINGKPTDPEEPEQPAKRLNLDVNLGSEKVYDFYSVGENEYQLADTKPEETAENETKGYVEITTKDLVYNKETNKIKFTVDYGVSDNKRDIRFITLVMFYDSSQLTFNGLDGGSILGIHNDDPNKPPTGPIKRWSSGDYGEFNLVRDSEETWVSDGDVLTDRMVYLVWIYNNSPEGRTFDDFIEQKGFIGDKPMPAKLFDALFTPTKDFTGSTQINFKVRPISKGHAGWKYGNKVSPIVITNSEPEPKVNSTSHPGWNIDLTLDVQALKTHLVQSLAEDKRGASCKIYFSKNRFTQGTDEELPPQIYGPGSQSKDCDSSYELEKLALSNIESNQQYYAMLVLEDDGKTVAKSKQFEFKHEMYVQIVTPEDIQIDQINQTIDFKLDYDVSSKDKEGLDSLVLLMHYNSETLTWNGLKNDQQNTVHGLASGSNSANASDLNPIKKWEYLHYGELNKILNRSEDSEDGNSFDYDKDINTKQLVAIMWSKNERGGATFTDDSNTLGFVGKKEYPFDLFTTSFKVNLEDDEEQRINFSQIETVDLEPYQSQSFDKYQLKAKSIIISKKNGIISAKLDKDYTYDSKETNTPTLLDDLTESEDPNSVDCTDCKYIEIKPDVETISFDPQTNQDVSFSVDYSVDTKRIPSLFLYIYYDYQKLLWNGLGKDSILGLYDPNNLNELSDHINKENWKDTEFGEFRGVHDHWYGEKYDTYKKYFEEGDLSDSDDDTNAVILLRWSRPTTGKGTFSSGSSGFVKEIPNRLTLFKTYFTPQPGFSGSTAINFRIGKQPDGGVGSDYKLKPTPVTITNN